MTEHDPQAPPQSPPPNPLQAALAAVTDLAGRVTKLTAEVAKLRTYGRRNRWFVVGDIILTVAIAGFGYLSVHTANAAHQNGVTLAQLHATQVNGCIAGNQTRAQEIQLWTHLAQVSAEQPAPHLTQRQLAQNKKEVAQLLAYIRTTFAPRDCKTLYKLPGGTS